MTRQKEEGREEGMREVLMKKWQQDFMEEPHEDTEEKDTQRIRRK